MFLDEDDLKADAQQYAMRVVDALFGQPLKSIPAGLTDSIAKSYIDGYRKGANDKYVELTTKRSHHDTNT